jgi:glucose-1-phosphate thymidylyltransferase
MLRRKGIVLAGGSGTRLYPSTVSVSKQLLPVFDKPMVYYPLSTLMLADITEVLIITTPEDYEGFHSLLGDGSDWGLSLSYASQKSPDGLAQALIIAKDFLNGSPSALVLGDNIFYGHELRDLLVTVPDDQIGATIFAYHVSNPQDYGVVEFDEAGSVKKIEEKPINPRSSYAITGLYFYDSRASDLAACLLPSERGELEITDLNRLYLDMNELNVELLGRGFAWLDAGTPEALLEAGHFIATMERRQGQKISCPEEIAWRLGLINDEKLSNLIKKNPNVGYSNYLAKILKLSDSINSEKNQ